MCAVIVHNIEIIYKVETIELTKLKMSDFFLCISISLLLMSAAHLRVCLCLCVCSALMFLLLPISSSGLIRMCWNYTLSLCDDVDVPISGSVPFGMSLNGLKSIAPSQ